MATFLPAIKPAIPLFLAAFSAAVGAGLKNRLVICVAAGLGAAGLPQPKSAGAKRTAVNRAALNEAAAEDWTPSLAPDEDALLALGTPCARPSFAAAVREKLGTRCARHPRYR